MDAAQNNSVQTMPPPAPIIGPESNNKGSKNLSRLIIASFLIVAILLIVISAQIWLSKSTQMSFFNLFRNIKANQLIVELPLHEDSKIIRRVDVIIYQFKSTVKNITESNPPRIEFTDAIIPPMVIEAKATILLEKNGITTQATISDIKVGQRVAVFAAYYPTKKTWDLQSVNIQN